MKDSRTLKVLFGKSGSGSVNTRITLPITWIKEMGITQDDKEVDVNFNNGVITIQKKPDITLDIVIKQFNSNIHNVKNGADFEIKELFNGSDWEQYSASSRRSVGKDFKKALKNKEYNLHNYIEYNETKSDNHNFYVKI